MSNQANKQSDFEQKLKEIFENRAEEVIQSHYLTKPKSFRVNTLISNEKGVIDEMKNEKWEIRESEIRNGYSISEKENISISKSKFFENSEIYIQELSSMLPVQILGPQKGERIIDLCAAPGSKTSQILAMTENNVELHAVEKSRGRFFKMKEIVENFGGKNVKFHLDDANILAKKYPWMLNYFDKILLDAPCSNEGSIDFNNPSTLKYWSSKEGRKISKLQKGLLNSAIKLLKPGGILIYSTCTYSVEENESVVNWALDKNEDMQLEDIDLKIENKIPGRVEWREKSLNPELNKTIRVLPNEYWKGFYLARLRKER